MIESEVFRKQMYCIVESACDIVGLFDPPAVILVSIVIQRPGNYSPMLPPSLRPCNTRIKVSALPTLLMIRFTFDKAQCTCTFLLHCTCFLLHGLIKVLLHMTKGRVRKCDDPNKKTAFVYQTRAT